MLTDRVVPRGAPILIHGKYFPDKHGDEQTETVHGNVTRVDENIITEHLNYTNIYLISLYLIAFNVVVGKGFKELMPWKLCRRIREAVTKKFFF